MRIEAEVLLAEISQKCQELVPLLLALKTATVECMVTEELADTAFATREAMANLDVLSSQIKEVHALAGARCAICMAAMQQEIVRTDYCSAVPNHETWYKVPHKRDSNPEKWDEIMEGLGVSNLANHKDIVRIHPPGLMAYCAELLAEGKQPPAGISPTEMTGMKLKVKLTRRRSCPDGEK